MSDDGGRASSPRGRPSAQDSGSTADHDVLARRLAEVARTLQQQSGPEDVMDRVVASVVAMVPGAEECSISLVREGRDVTSTAATGDLSRRLDALQQQTGQGPCVDAMYEHVTVRVDDLATEERWPALAARAGEVGVASMLCFQLYVHGRDLGALTLIARAPGAFDDESEHVGLLLASHAAVAVVGAQQLEGAALALASRDVIGQAKGILMERFKISADQAFAALLKVSQDTNTKLYEVARTLADTGTIT